jgi:hypothetical protein
MTRRAPIIASLYPQDMKLFVDYMDALRADHIGAAAAETERLGPYFNALSQQLQADADALQARSPELDRLSQKKTLSQLFNKVARQTGSAILSELVIGPEAIFNRTDTMRNSKSFRGTLKYEGLPFTFGFMQAFNEERSASVTVPLLTIDNGVLTSISRHRPEALLRALQALTTAGTHDMLHHYTNAVLNPAIVDHAGKDGKAPRPALSAVDWFRHYFASRKQDSDMNSYESWSTLNHARMRGRLEKGGDLKQHCDAFFDELARIGAEVGEAYSEKKAHDTVDYLGTVFIHEMLRYIPLDDPLFMHALKKLEQADPAPEAVTSKEGEILAEARRNTRYMNGTVENYRAAGLDLVPENPGYAELKRLQAVAISPWIAHLLSPARPGTTLAAMKDRVPQANIEMVTSVAWGAWFDTSDGRHAIDLPQGGRAEVHFKDGVLHRDGGPAFIRETPYGGREEEWYKNGQKREPTPAKPVPSATP